MKNYKLTVSDGIVYDIDGSVLVDNFRTLSDGGLQALLGVARSYGYSQGTDRVLDMLANSGKPTNPQPNPNRADEALGRDLGVTVYGPDIAGDPFDGLQAADR